MDVSGPLDDRVPVTLAGSTRFSDAVSGDISSKAQAPSSSQTDVEPARPAMAGARKTSGLTFVTARTEPMQDELDDVDEDPQHDDHENVANIGRVSEADSANNVLLHGDVGEPQQQSTTAMTISDARIMSHVPHSAHNASYAAAGSDYNSTTSLLPSSRPEAGCAKSSLSTTAYGHLRPERDATAIDSKPMTAFDSTMRVNSNRIRFDTPALKARKAELQVKARLAQAHAGTQRITRPFARKKFNSGQIVKMTKMLVRLDFSISTGHPEGEYDEKLSRTVDTRVVEKWREYMVVCRQINDDDAALTIQFYKTRVIPVIDQRRSRKRFKREILLDRHMVKVNIYSALDKTIVIWCPNRDRTEFTYLQPQSGVAAVEWYHFLRQGLGHQRPPVIQVNVPALNVNIRLTDPFNSLLGDQELELAADGDDRMLAHVIAVERDIARTLTNRCLDLLSTNADWSTLIEHRTKSIQIGLAWRRYDRLEWVHGAYERSMYGAIAMLKTHVLELRTKEHYPTSIKTNIETLIDEPCPVEGFLIRLKTRSAMSQRLAKLFYRRLYFATQDQYLVFSRLEKAMPPRPPHDALTRAFDGTTEVIGEMLPAGYRIAPFSLDGERIA